MSVTCPQGHTSGATDYCDTCGAPIHSSARARPAAAPAGPPPAAPAAPVSAASTGVSCPNCQVANVAGALFCEACGYDFTTGALPRVPASSLDLAAPRPVPGRTPSGAAVPDPTLPDPGVPDRAVPDAAVPDRAVPDAAAPDPAPAPLAPSVPLEWVAEVWVDPDWYKEQEADEPCPSPGLPAIVPLTVRSLLIGRVSRSRNIHPELDCGDDIGISRRQAQLSTDGSRWWIEDLQSSNGTYVGSAGGPLPTVALVPGQRRELVEGDRVYVGAWTRIVVRRATEEERSGA